MPSSSLPHRLALRVVGRGRDDARRPFNTDNVHGKLCPLPGETVVDQRQGDALADGVAIAAGGDEADPPAYVPDRLEAAGVGVDCIDFERDDTLRHAPLALLQRRLAADETALVEGNEAVEPGLAGR